MNYTIPGDPVTDRLAGKITTEEMLKLLIEEDQNSKNKKEMIQSINYYNMNHDILKRKFNTFIIEGNTVTDPNKSDEHMVNPFHTFLVDQKTGYIAGKPVIFETDNEDLKALIGIEIDLEKFADVIMDYVEGASIKGYEILYPFVGPNNTFKYTILAAEGTIVIKDTQFQDDIMQTVRYYTMDVLENGKSYESFRVEVYDSEKITFYQQDQEGNFFFIPSGQLGITFNPSYYRYSWDGEENKDLVTVVRENFEGVTEVAIETHGWESGVPTIQLMNNTRQSTDLRPIKTYIDALDIITSGFINDLADVQLMIWILRGIGQEDLSTFMKNLLNFKAILLDGDPDEASVDTKVMDIPITARESLIKYCEKQIYKLGAGVNLEEMSSGNITNIGIKVHFSNLDTKANKLIIKLKASLQLFSKFLIEFINEKYSKTFDIDELKVVVTKSMMFNDTEIINGLLASGTILSKKTIVELHPWVENVEQELERLEEDAANEPVEINFEEDVKEEIDGD